ncbi:hypothetical protein SOVF_123080 [Spinacia oleracea]|uniref:CCHC-type domain-containing protein n=1 Tax=Spinacia oleracea TaxID=3562 RepID=A0A9R0I991_SPIOL|nr:uncharacterized protein LOC110784836 [Spinacia oleracea]KNA12755.1 hypothetical protein SOVF_123080 [Spinacia oleracea]
MLPRTPMANSKSTIIDIPEDVEDVEFLSQLDAAEAQAISLSASKRRRVSVDSAVKLERENQGFVQVIEEGAYTAALKGSKSLTWQKQQQVSLTKTPQSSVTTTAGGGACFKCGKEGHWARDCPQAMSPAVNLGSGPPHATAVAGVEKACPCGMGICLLLTANTERNPGRKFFRCPIRQENGGCGFFEWCDESSAKMTSPGDKSWKNVEQQQFYQRPTNQASGYTKSWNDFDKGTSAPNSSYGQKFEATDNRSYGMKSGSSTSSCFKCGQEGHWAKDCLTTSSNATATTTVTATTGARGNQSSGTCYKCGQSGHWARDCSQSQGQSTKVRNW